MEKLVFDYSKALGFFSESELEMMKEQVAVAEKFLNEKNGAGNDYLGWIELPTNYDKDEFERYLDYETEWNIYNSASDSFQTLARVLDLKPTDYILRDDSNR